MKKIKIHIWFIINLAVIAIFFYDIRSPFIPLALLINVLSSTFLLKRWEEVKKEYTSPVSQKFILIPVIFFILLIILLVFSGSLKEYKVYISSWDFLWISRVVAIFLFCVLVFAYVRLLRGKNNEIIS